MGKLVHTVSLVSQMAPAAGLLPPTRESDSRHYTHCIIATATAKSVETRKAEQAEQVKKIAEAEAKVAQLAAEFGGTPEEAQAAYDALLVPYNNKETGHQATYQRVSKELAASLGLAELPFMDERLYPAIKADLAARGIDPDPHHSLPANYLGSIYSVKCAREWLDHLKDVEVGQQGVVSWHQSASLAEKALKSRDAKYRVKRGDTLAICADVTIRERASRGKKAAS